MLERLKTPNRRAAVMSIAIFAILAFGDSGQIWIAIVGAIFAYVVLTAVGSGSRGAGRGRETAQERQERSTLAVESSRTKIETIRTLAAKVPKEGTRDLALRIADQSQGALDLIESKGATLAAPLLLEQLLEPAEGMLDTYIRLTERGRDAASALLYQYEAQDLPMIERAARLFREKLQQEGALDLKVLEQTLAFTPEGSGTVTPIPTKK